MNNNQNTMNTNQTAVSGFLVSVSVRAAGQIAKMIGLVAAMTVSLSAAPWPAPAAPPLKVGVDPRVELMCILFRLAGKPEYNQGRVPTYLEEIDRHFAPASQHPAVLLTRQMGSKVGFDAPMHLAVHLTDVETLALRLPLKPWPEGLDQRWRSVELQEFLAKARQFAQEAKFDAFYRAHDQFYAETAARARKVLLTDGRLDWFDGFFGPRPGVRFKFVPGLVNGGCCYGARVKLPQEEEVYCILGVVRCDQDGQPVFTRDELEIVAHEYSHCYLSPHFHGWAKKLKKPGERLYAHVRSRMKQMAYGDWMTMINESTVRAVVVRYVEATQGSEAVARQVRQEIDRGFLWTEGLARLLGEYDTRRQQYPTLREFMPRVVEFFKSAANGLPADQGQ
jgi:hypothetical protein